MTTPTERMLLTNQYHIMNTMLKVLTLNERDRAMLDLACEQTLAVVSGHLEVEKLTGSAND